MKPKLIVMGHGRHGKDTVCEILRDNHGFSFVSSSRFLSRRFLFEQLRPKYGYATEEECFNDRHNHRQEWFGAIRDYNADDLARLGREIFKENDVYAGLRNVDEMEAMRDEGLFDHAIWVDRSAHLPPEPKNSMTITRGHADIVIDNNGTMEDLRTSVSELVKEITK